MDSLFSLAFITSAVVSAAVALAAWHRRYAPGAYGLALLCFGQSLWSALYALQWIFTDHGPSLPWLVARLAALEIGPTAILVLVLQFTGRTRWLTRRNIALLLVQPVAILLIAATDSIHGWYLQGQPPAIILNTGSPVIWLNAAYSYCLMFLAIGLLVARPGTQKRYRTQTRVMLVALTIPVVHYLLQFMGFYLVPGVNSVPFSFTLTGILEWYAITRLGVFEVIPVAREQLIEQMTKGILVFDSIGHIADINPAACQMIGTSSECISHTPQESFPRYARTINELRAGLELDGQQAVARAPMMPGGLMEVSASRVHAANGEHVATVVTLQDVTEQARAAAELESRGVQLKAAIARSRSILTAMNDGILLADGQDRLMHSNRAAGEILGIELETLEGADLWQLLPSLPVRELTNSVAATGKPTTTALVVGSNRIVAVEVIPLRQAQGQGARTLFVLKDETERLAAERMQRDFIANAAHELQTPLTGLSLLAETIPRAMESDPESVGHFVERLALEVDRLKRMTGELMMLSRLEQNAQSDAPIETDVAIVIADEIEAHGAQAESKHQTITSCVEGDVYVPCDKVDLRLIVSNLLQNAIRYSEEGGRIDVRLRTQQDDEGSWAVIDVADNGIGIPTSEIDRIFERFYRVDKARARATGGAGLGLSIVHNAVLRYGGRLMVDSTVGEGTTFTVRLPLLDSATSADGEEEIAS